MIQVNHCECGESSMLDGRCTGCKRIRPSSSEIREQIQKHSESLSILLRDMERAQMLEAEEAQQAQQAQHGHDRPVCQCKEDHGSWFSRSEPMGYICNKCGCEVVAADCDPEEYKTCTLEDKCPDNPMCETCECYTACYPYTWAALEEKENKDKNKK